MKCYALLDIIYVFIHVNVYRYIWRNLWVAFIWDLKRFLGFTAELMPDLCRRAGFPINTPLTLFEVKLFYNLAPSCIFSSSAISVMWLENIYEAVWFIWKEDATRKDRLQLKAETTDFDDFPFVFGRKWSPTWWSW